MSRRILLLNLLIVLLGIIIGVVTNVATQQIPEQVKPFLGWPTLVILIAVFLLFNVIYLIYTSQNPPPNPPPHPPSPPPPDEDALLTTYLEGIVNQVGEINLSGIDPTLAADARRSRLFLPSVYIDLETQAAGGVRVSVVQKMKDETRLVLLGDPGSGKSTFVNFVALCMAGEKLAREDANLDQLGRIWPRRGWFLPVRVVLRDFVARGLPPVGEKATSEHLQTFLEAEVGADFAPVLREYLLGREGKRAMVLLDGFDEVPEANERRKQVMDVVRSVVREYGNCRFLLTSRTYAWERQGWQLAGFAEARLAALRPEQIEDFVDRWYKEVSQLRRSDMSSEQAVGRAARLKQAIADNTRLSELASRPLLLTLMASLHAWRGGDLPEKREKLYDNALDLLLYIWEQKGIVRDAQGKEKVILQSMQEILKVERDKLLQALEQVGYEAHAGQLDQEGMADIAGATLAQALRQISRDPDLKPGLIEQYMQNRAGLLLPVGNDVYKFPHRSFQEYLAARYLTKKEPDEIADLVRADPERWQEVVLLAIARITVGFPAGAWQLVHALAPHDPSAHPDANAGWAAYIAAAAIIENGLHQNISRTHQQKLERIQKWLLIVLELGLLPPIQRDAAGYALAQLGDTRPGVTSLPPLLTQPIHIQGANAPFQAAVYPVTNAQFGEFVHANGYHESRWWNGELDRLQHRANEGEQAISKPKFWDDARLNAANQPVVGVSYYEAEAFCRWLSEKEGRPYRLPTEAEWQQLAQGDNNRAYPWGNDWQADAANTHQSAIGKPCAVGLFPEGVSPTGAHECAGNVWEWCATWYDEQQRTRRVLRGGSWDSNPDETRCTHRFWSAPRDCNHETGFRVVAG